MSMTAVIIDDDLFTLADLAHSCNVSPEWIAIRLEAGLLNLTITDAQQVRYTSAELTRARRLCNIERNFDANSELAALVVDMMEEIERLKYQIHRLDKYAIDV